MNVSRRNVFIWVLVLPLTCLIPANSSWAWGRLGHQLIGEVGAELAGSGQNFWQKNAVNIGNLATVPDAVWKSGSSAASEGPTHWFHIDAYSNKPWDLPPVFESYQDAVNTFGSPTILENGTALWRSRQFFERAVEDFQMGRYESGLQMAGVLAHYIGDLSQPLHVTIDYDGRYGLQTGIHSFFESRNIQNRDRQFLKTQLSAKAAALLKNPVFVASIDGGVHKAVQQEMARAADFIEKVLEQDENLGRGSQGSNAQLNLALDRMADGAATLALILSDMWIEAGRPPLDQTLSVGTPAWVVPAYHFLENGDAAHDCL